MGKRSGFVGNQDFMINIDAEDITVCVPNS